MIKTNTTQENESWALLIKHSLCSVFVLCLIGLFFNMGVLGVNVGMTQLGADLGITGTRLELISAIIGVAFSLTAILGGYLSDRVRRTKIIAASVIVSSVSITLTGFCNTFETLLFLRIVSGICKGFIYPGLITLLFDFVPRRFWNTAFAVFIIASSMGGSISYIGSGLILKKFERYDTKLIRREMLNGNEMQINGWGLQKSAELHDGKVQFVFKSREGKTLNIELSGLSERQNADFRSKLFNVVYKGEGVSGKDSEEIQRAKATFNKHILENEAGVVLRQSVSEYDSYAGFTMPDIPIEYKDRFVFYPRQGFVFHGIMTREDYKILSGMSTDHKYNEAVSALYRKSLHMYQTTDGWRRIFWTFGPIGLVFAFLALLLKEPQRGIYDDNRVIIDSAEKKHGLWGLLKKPVTALILFSGLISMGGISGINLWTSIFIEGYRNVDLSDAAKLSGLTAFSLLAIPVSGIIADAFGKIYARIDLYIIIIALFLGAALSYIVIQTESEAVTWAGFCAFGFFIGCVNVPFMVFLLSRAEPHLRATLYGAYILLSLVVSNSISTIGMGLLSDRYNLKTALCFMSILLILGGIGFIAVGVLLKRRLGEFHQTSAVDRKSGLH